MVGNNLANLNTPGFKSNVVSFHDLVTQSLGAGLGETQVGLASAGRLRSGNSRKEQSKQATVRWMPRSRVTVSWW